MLNSLILNSSKGPINYPKWPVIPLAPILAYIALAFAERFSHKIALVTPAFYVAWFVSCIIVFLITYVVYWVTVRFDAHYPWHTEAKTRIKKQLLAGLLIPTCFAFILATIYFFCFSIDIFETIWLRRYLPAVLTLLLIINSSLGFYGSFVEGKLKLKVAEKALVTARVLAAPAVIAKVDVVEMQELSVPTLVLEPVIPSPIPIPIVAPNFTEPLALFTSSQKVLNNLKNELRIDAAVLDIACVFCCNKHYYAVDYEGEIDSWDHNVRDSELLLPDSYFFLVDRSFIINFAAIKEIKSAGSKVTRVILLPQVVDGIVKTYLKATGEQTAHTKEAYTTVHHKVKAKKILNSKEFVLSVSYKQKKSFITARNKFLADLKSHLLSLKSKP